MDFFRQHKKAIVGFIFVAVVLWLIGGTAHIKYFNIFRVIA